jgi:hypothetical protein
MQKITDEVRPALQGIVPSTLVTCSREGMPNINYISQVYYVDDEHVALSNQFFSKSIRNIDENPQATVSVVHPDDLFMWRIELHFIRRETEGELFDQMSLQLEAIASMTGMEDVFRLQSAYIFKVLHLEKIKAEEEPVT